MTAIEYERKHGRRRHSHAFDADLDSIDAFKTFADGSELEWGIAVTHAPPAWPEETGPVVLGVDWRAEFTSPGKGQLPIPVVDEGSTKIELRPIDEHWVLIRVQTGETTVNGAKDVGRTAVQAALGMLQTRFLALTFQRVLWEGPIRSLGGGKSWFGSGASVVSVEGVTAKNILELGLEFVAARVLEFPSYLTLALNWYSRSWFTDSTPERFVDLWLAVVVLVDHTYTKTQLRNTNQMDRVKDYVKALALPSAKATSLAKVLKDSYSIRNEVVHQGVTERVTADTIEDLQVAVEDLLATELASQVKIK